MLETIRTVAIAVTSASLLVIAVAAVLASGNGRWVGLGAPALLDTRTGRVCTISPEGQGYCEDYAGFRVNR